jgi:transposase
MMSVSTSAPVYSHYLGIDVSKLTLDLCLINSEGKILQQLQIPNNTESWLSVTKLFKKYGLRVDDVLICGEHTGMYTYHLLGWAVQGANVWVESGKAIKHSQGIARGKNDAKDAARIATYAMRFQKKARLWQPLDETIEQLKYLETLRQRLLAAFNAIDVPMREQKNFIHPSHFEMLEKLTNPATDALKEQIKTVEEQLKQTIENDDNLKNQLELLDSIPGIATKMGIGLIIKTKGFTAFKNARQFTCHAGVAPFDHRSGTSVKGKNEVSCHADKELKKMLHLAAMAAIRTKGIIQDYYLRKQKEGKSKMSVLNAIRNKIALIAFAVIKNNKLFDNNHQFSFEIS